MSEQIKIVIADDHSMIREGLKQLLELDGDIIVVEEAANGKAFVHFFLYFSDINSMSD